jgi:hypothetical protein
MCEVKRYDCYHLEFLNQALVFGNVVPVYMRTRSILKLCRFSRIQFQNNFSESGYGSRTDVTFNFSSKQFDALKWQNSLLITKVNRYRTVRYLPYVLGSAPDP